MNHRFPEKDCCESDWRRLFRRPPRRSMPCASRSVSRTVNPTLVSTESLLEWYINETPCPPVPVSPIVLERSMDKTITGRKFRTRSLKSHNRPPVFPHLSLHQIPTGSSSHHRPQMVSFEAMYSNVYIVTFVGLVGTSRE